MEILLGILMIGLMAALWLAKKAQSEARLQLMRAESNERRIELARLQRELKVKEFNYEKARAEFDSKRVINVDPDRFKKPGPK